MCQWEIFELIHFVDKSYAVIMGAEIRRENGCTLYYINKKTNYSNIIHSRSRACLRDRAPV